MSNRTVLQQFNDWSEIRIDDSFVKGIDLSRPENFGIHKYKDELWTSGYVGVGRIYGTNGRPLTTKGKEHIAVVTPRYPLDPWRMLEKVMTDEEYDSYVTELENNGKYLFKVFYEQPVIQLSQDYQCECDILYALSFVNQCFALCRKGINRRMIHCEENFTSRIRGKIDIKNNIKKNTFKGRNDRFYCKYIDFTMDTTENRILKATLIKCKKVVESKFEMSSEIVSRLRYCMNAFRSVKSVSVNNSDFNNVNVTGLYSYYKPLIKQAKSILKRSFCFYKSESGTVVAKSVYVIPYMINMEALFEFYTRNIIRNKLDSNKYYLSKYSNQVAIYNKDIYKERKHLISYCIPDMIICDKITNKPVVVLDAKYKRHDESDRNDTHQLLSYVLLTGVNKCGFVFPGEKTTIKTDNGDEFTSISTQLLPQLNYYELFIGDENGVGCAIEKIL